MVREEKRDDVDQVRCIPVLVHAADPVDVRDLPPDAAWESVVESGAGPLDCVESRREIEVEMGLVVRCSRCGRVIHERVPEDELPESLRRSGRGSPRAPPQVWLR